MRLRSYTVGIRDLLLDTSHPDNSDVTRGPLLETDRRSDDEQNDEIYDKSDDDREHD
ncbi:hypothetical protein [Haloarchaeobius sp. DFWS5]|uniref:hypothetical protein n=1 Tax=Haloarchaeobius sp. DFWS5 TaxID=3446114 RepID=UPI003EB73EDD